MTGLHNLREMETVTPHARFQVVRVAAVEQEMNGSGIRESADELMEACTKSGELLDELSSPDNNGDNHPADSREGNFRDPWETLTALRDLAEKIDKLSDSLAYKVRSYRDECNREINGGTHPASTRERGIERGTKSTGY